MRDYYDLPKDNVKMRDIILSIRADETIHREINHHFADLSPDEDIERSKIYVKGGQGEDQHVEEVVENIHADTDPAPKEQRP